jgi:hypothetical protein
MDVVEVTFFSVLAHQSHSPVPRKVVREKAVVARNPSPARSWHSSDRSDYRFRPAWRPSSITCFFGAKVRTEWFGIAVLALVLFWHWRIGTRRTL